MPTDISKAPGCCGAAMALSKIDLALRLHGIVERHYRCMQCGSERTRTVISPAEVHDHRSLSQRNPDDRLRA